MPREVVTLQVGQCGNQIGGRFWDLALQEHVASASTSSSGTTGSSSLQFDDALSTFFRNVDRRNNGSIDPASTKEIKTLRARAVLIDMEDGVVNACLNGPLGDLFDRSQIVTDVSGAGNNWAHGYFEYGQKTYHSRISNAVRVAVERCDSLQCFLLLQSTGGGTGSGVGTYTLGKILADHYPEYHRFVSCVTPSKEDDVITSPYNAILSLNQMIEHAHCVLPVNNDSLINLVNKISNSAASKASSCGSTTSTGVAASLLQMQAGGPAGALQLQARAAGSGISTKTPGGAAVVPTAAKRSPPGGAPGPAAAAKSSGPPFGDMNLLVAQMLNHLTASMRYSGSLNLDLNEITTNLVPYPRMHFLNSALSPLTISKDRALQPRSFDQMFAEVALTSDHSLCFSQLSAYDQAQAVGNVNAAALAGAMMQLDHGGSGSGGESCSSVDPRLHTTLAQAFLVRSVDCGIADVTRNVTKVKEKLKFLPFNEDAIKIGLCSAPPTSYRHSCLGLSNNCGVNPGLLEKVERNFLRLYKRKAHVHHYTAYMEAEEFEFAKENLRGLINDYAEVDAKMCPPTRVLREASEAERGGRGGCGGMVDWPSVLFQPSRYTLEKAAREWLPKPLI